MYSLAFFCFRLKLISYWLAVQFQLLTIQLRISRNFHHHLNQVGYLFHFFSLILSCIFFSDFLFSIFFSSFVKRFVYILLYTTLSNGNDPLLKVCHEFVDLLNIHCVLILSWKFIIIRSIKIKSWMLINLQLFQEQIFYI